jgi:microcin C transport system permease protein
VLTGAVQGFFGGKTDLAFQRFIDDLGLHARAVPADHLFSAVFAPSVALLLMLLSLFGWMGLSGLRAGRIPAQPAARLRACRARTGRGQLADHHGAMCCPTA